MNFNFNEIVQIYQYKSSLIVKISKFLFIHHTRSFSYGWIPGPEGNELLLII